MNAFTDKFSFRPEWTLRTAVERERFITDASSTLVPHAMQVLEALTGSDGRFTNELSACQIEDRTGPFEVKDILDQLKYNDELLETACRTLGLKVLCAEVGPDDMCLDVFPHERYQQMVQKMSMAELRAACQITGTHVHIGMPGPHTAINVYNQVISHLDELVEMGDNSKGRRLEIYRIVKPNCHPKPYNSWQDFNDQALALGFAENPRNNWDLIRISRHGTIEFRLFGVTKDREQVVFWARRCHELCATYL